MNRIITSAGAALLATTSLVNAGGVERQAQSPAILFETGTYVELGFTFFDPDVSGVQTFPTVPMAGVVQGSSSGDVAPSYSYASFAYRQDISEQLSVALIYDQPIGADVDYAADGPPGYLYRFGAGSQAEIRSQQLTAALRYEVTPNISVYGGLRAVTANGNVQLFNGSDGGAGRYVLDAESDYELGYMIGAAYEQPDIALRVALTYYSATEHTFTGFEGSDTGGTGPTSFQTTIPQQVLLEAQTGVAEGTLVFGSIRWTDWTEFDITPPGFFTSSGTSLVDYDSDIWTYTLGGARRLNDNWALLGSVTYEPQTGGFSGNLNPTDGRTSFGLAARYTQGAYMVTAGVNYTHIGDAVTEAPGALMAPPGTEYGSFTDNSGLGFGLRIGYRF